ncbi:MAG: SUMF1/EgtB/PvdO family nonheme iron enzyme [Fibrobacter sp.]|nr:SUMF1/EgtB/PvdO family nonheme iron enzyme [Fibrobacter sp.]
MKMNNLNNPSRVILSNLARVILSKAKNPVLAASLVALVACTDYLDDFQDKYDNGNAFAEISSDSELSSSSKGNGDAESSDSKNSSSSVADQENLCKGGTVIYDYKVQGKLGFDLQFFRSSYSSTLPENERGIVFSSLEEKDYAGFRWNGSYDVSSWEGICIEYTTDKDVSLYLGDSKKTEKVNLSANDNFKEIKWDDPAYKENISFNDFRKFFFDFSDEINMVISRITTIAKVDPGSSSSVAESSSAFEPCKGTVIYDYKNPGKLGLNLQFLPNATTTKLPENGQGIELSSNTEQNYAIFALSGNDLHDVSSWEGLCLEYSSNEDIPLYLADLLDNIEQINLPANDHFKEISWADTTSRKISINGRGRVSFNKFDSFSFGINTTKKVTISRITTIAKVDPGSSSSVAESSSSIAFDNGPCTGDIVFDENNSNNNFSESFIPNNSSVVSSNEFTIPEGEISSYLYTLSSTYTSDSTFDITSWEGLCVDYEASEDIYLSINTASYGNLRNGVASKATLPKTNGETKRKTWMWNDFSPNGPAIASNTAILQVSPSTNSNKSAVHIRRITTAKKTTSNPQKASLTEAQFARVDLLNWQLHDRTWPDFSGSTAYDVCEIKDIKNANDPTLYSYEGAKTYCNKLSDANGTWRLPTKTEWENLLSTFDHWGNDATNTYHFLFGDEPINNYGYCVSNNSIKYKLGFWTAEGGFAEFRPQQIPTNGDMYLSNDSNQSGYANVRCVQDAK